MNQIFEIAYYNDDYQQIFLYITDDIKKIKENSKEYKIVEEQCKKDGGYIEITSFSVQELIDRYFFCENLKDFKINEKIKVKNDE